MISEVLMEVFMRLKITAHRGVGQERRSVGGAASSFWSGAASATPLWIRLRELQRIQSAFTASLCRCTPHFVLNKTIKNAFACEIKMNCLSSRKASRRD